MWLLENFYFDGDGYPTFTFAGLYKTKKDAIESFRKDLNKNPETIKRYKNGNPVMVVKKFDYDYWGAGYSDCDIKRTVIHGWKLNYMKEWEECLVSTITECDSVHSLEYPITLERAIELATKFKDMLLEEKEIDEEHMTTADYLSIQSETDMTDEEMGFLGMCIDPYDLEDCYGDGDDEE